MPFVFNPFTATLDWTNSTSGFATGSFTTVQPDSGTAPVASGTTDTLTFTSTSNSGVRDLTITGNSSTDTVTFDINRAIVPTWTGAHTWSAAATFNSTAAFNSTTSFAGQSTWSSGGPKTNQSVNTTFGTSGEFTLTYDGTNLQLTSGSNRTFNWTNVRHFVDNTDIYHRFGGAPTTTKTGPGAPTDSTDRTFSRNNTTATSGTKRALVGWFDTGNTSVSSGINMGIQGVSQYQGSGGMNGSNGIVAIQGLTYTFSTSSGTLTGVFGFQASPTVDGSVNITNHRSFSASGCTFVGSGVVTNAVNFYGTAHTDTGSGSITNAYGLHLEKQTAGATNNCEIAINTTGGIFFAIGSSANNYINSDGPGSELDFHTDGTFKWKVSGTLSMSATATAMTLSNGSTNPVLDWSNTGGLLALTTGHFVDKSTHAETPGATVTISLTTGAQLRTWTAGENETVNLSGTQTIGDILILKILNDATPRTITFGTAFVSAGVIIGIASKTSIVTFISDGTNFYEASRTVGI